MPPGVSQGGPSSAGGQPTLVLPQRFSGAAVSKSLPPGRREEEARPGGLLRTSSGSRVVGHRTEAADVSSSRGASLGRLGMAPSHRVANESLRGNSVPFFSCVVPGESAQASSHSPASKRRGGLCFYLRQRIRQLIGHVEATPALTAAKTQRTPCGVNRYLLLCVYFFYSFLTARVYFAWPSLSNLLFRSNAYEWLCDGASPDLRLPENGGRRYRCEAQNSQVGSLFVTCLTFAFSCSLLAGILLDFLGPKITALIGQLCNMLAWLLLAFAGKGSQTYFPAFIFMGIGSDVGYLPVLSSANLFPGHEGLVVACLGAAKSLSFAIPAILDAIELGLEKSTLQDVSLGYVAIGPGFCVLLSLVLIPLQAFVPWNEFVYLDEEPQLAAARPLVRVNDSFASYEAHAWRDSFSSFQDVKDWMHQHHLATPLEELTHTNAAAAAAASSTRGPLLSSSFFAANATVPAGGGGSAPTSTGPGQTLDTPGAAAGSGSGVAAGSVTSTPSVGLHGMETKGKTTDSSSSSSKAGAAVAKEEATEHGRAPDVSTAVYGSVSTEAFFPSAAALESGSSADTMTAADADIQRGLQHPGAQDGVTVEELQRQEEDAIREGPTEDAGQPTREKGDAIAGTPAAGVDRLLSLDTSAHSPATAAAAGETGKRPSDPDEVTAGGETAAITTGSEAAAAPEEETCAVTVHEEEEEHVLREEGNVALAASPETRGNALAAEEETSDRAAVSSAGGRRRSIAALQVRRGRRDDRSRGGARSSSVRSHGTAGRHREEIATTPSFRRQFLSKYSFGIIFYSVLKALMYAFFTTGGENLLGKRVNDFLGAALPFSCIPCILLGKVVDLMGIMPVLLLLNTCITLAYAFSMIPSTGTAYLGALLYICYVSFYSSQSYCYVSDTFSSCHFGKLVGTIHMIAGLLSLLKIPMQSMVVHVFHSNYLYPCVFMLVFCGANFIVLIWLVFLKRKDPHPFWPQSARDAAAAEIARRKELRLQEKQKKNRQQQSQPHETSAAGEEHPQQEQQNEPSHPPPADTADAVV